MFWIAEGSTAGVVLEDRPHASCCNIYPVLSQNLTLRRPFSVVLIEEQYLKFRMEMSVHTSVRPVMSNLIPICSYMIGSVIKPAGLFFVVQPIFAFLQIHFMHSLIFYKTIPLMLFLIQVWYGSLPGQERCLQCRLCLRMTTSFGCKPWVGRSL